MLPDCLPELGPPLEVTLYLARGQQHGGGHEAVPLRTPPNRDTPGPWVALFFWGPQGWTLFRQWSTLFCPFNFIFCYLGGGGLLFVPFVPFLFRRRGLKFCHCRSSPSIQSCAPTHSQTKQHHHVEKQWVWVVLFAANTDSIQSIFLNTFKFVFGASR